MATGTNIGSRRGDPCGRPRPGFREGGHKGRPNGYIAYIVVAQVLTLVAPGAHAQQPPDDRPARAEVWDLRLGTGVDQLPDAFADYACGTNGGPPSIPLTGWRDFLRCRGDAEGLREV